METLEQEIGTVAELVSAWTHLGGALLTVIFMLVVRAWRNWGRLGRLGWAVFTTATVLMFLASGIYHLMPLGGTPRLVCRHIDHSAIFLMIAGTFTPIHLVLFRGIYRWIPLIGVWTFAILGVTTKVLWLEGMPEWLSLGLYLGFGWLGGWSGSLVYRKFGFSVSAPLFLGGLAYSGGAVMDFAGAPVIAEGIFGPHEFFHVCVMVGVAFHWRFILRAIEAARLRRENAWKQMSERVASMKGFMKRHSEKTTFLHWVGPYEEESGSSSSSR